MNSNSVGVAGVLEELDDVKLAERLTAKREAKEMREAAKTRGADLLELEQLELEEKYEAELGPRGKSWDLVDASDLGEGFIVVEVGAAVLHKQFVASKQTQADVDKYVVPCVKHPSKEKYREIVDRRPALAIRCGNALATLYGVKKGSDEGKF